MPDLLSTSTISSLQKLGPTSELLPVSKLPAGPLRGWREEGPPRTFLLQEETTIRATGSIQSVTQEDSGWLDLGAFADAAFWVEIAEVTNAGGSGGSGTVSLYIESSPTWDESNFKPIAPPLVVATSTSPTGVVVPQLVRCVRTPGTVLLSRWTRWRLQSTATGTWDVTFRIRGTAGAANFFVPTMLQNCMLWLRGDLGITKDASNFVTNWADQTPNGHDAKQSGTSAPVPSYNVSPIGGQPSLRFDPTASQSLLVTSLPICTHVFLVQRRLTASDSNQAYTGLWRLANSSANGTRFPSHVDGHIYDDCMSQTTKDTGSPAVALNVASVYEVISDTNYWASWLNGKAQFSTSTNTPDFTGSNWLGYSGDNGANNRYYNGDIAEVVMYQRVLTTAERALLINYFNGRYGLGAV